MCLAVCLSLSYFVSLSLFSSLSILLSLSLSVSVSVCIINGNYWEDIKSKRELISTPSFASKSKVLVEMPLCAFLINMIAFFSLLVGGLIFLKIRVNILIYSYQNLIDQKKNKNLIPSSCFVTILLT